MSSEGRPHQIGWDSRLGLSLARSFSLLCRADGGPLTGLRVAEDYEHAFSLRHMRDERLGGAFKKQDGTLTVHTDR